MEGKNSFIVYADDIKEHLDDLTDEEVGVLFRAMVDYQLTGEEPTFKDRMLKHIFMPIRQMMSRNDTKWSATKQKRSEAGKKGGLRSGEARRNHSDKLTDNIISEANEANASFGSKNEANEAVKVKVKVNVKEKVKVKEDVSGDTVAVSDADPSSLSSSLISYLNEAVGSRYEATKSVISRISELLEAGYTEADMFGVIDKKVAEWKDDAKMRGFLRPKTLFGSKFEEYARAPATLEAEREKSKAETIEKLQKQREAEQQTLDTILEEMAAIRDGAGIKADWKDYKALADQKAIREQNIELIDQKLERLGAA